jgi:hypothetical protein
MRQAIAAPADWLESVETGYRPATNPRQPKI